MTERYEDYYKFEMPGTQMTLRMIRASKDLPELVIQDLENAETHEEQISILEDFSLACQRKYRNAMINNTSSKITSGLESMVSNIAGAVVPFLVEQEMPRPIRPYRAGRGTPVQRQDTSFVSPPRIQEGEKCLI